MTVHTVGVQHIHGTGEVGVSGGGTVALGDLAGGGGGGVSADLAVQVLEGLDLVVVTIDHQAEGVLGVGGGDSVLLLTAGIGVHAADNGVIAGGIQASQHGVPAVGDLELGLHTQTLGDLLGDLYLKAGELAGALVVVDVGDPVALGADGQLAGVQHTL